MIKVFVIDFSESNHITDILTRNNCLVEYENIDGGRAYKRIEEFMPNLVFINYSCKPSHGRQTAIAINKRKKTTQIPIYFIDGTQVEIDKIKGMGKSIKFDEIDGIMKKIKTVGNIVYKQ